MSHRIRKTEFTWDPQRESRGAVLNRIRRHLQAELDRIAEVSRRARIQARRRSSPTYQRNQAILRDHDVHGVDVATLARRHGLSPIRVREVIRLERHHRGCERFTASMPQGPVRVLPHRDLPDLPGIIPQTRALPTDP